MAYAVRFGNEGLLALVDPNGSHLGPREFLAETAAIRLQAGNGSVRSSGESHTLVVHRAHSFGPMIPLTTFDGALLLTRTFGSVACIASMTQSFGDRWFSAISSGADFISLGFLTGLIIHGGGKIYELFLKARGFYEKSKKKISEIEEFLR